MPVSSVLYWCILLQHSPVEHCTACWQYLSDNPAVVATCAVAGSFKGADIMNGETDDQLMTRTFIDHLENAPNNSGVLLHGKI